MHEGKGEEVLDTNSIGASSGRGQENIEVSLYETSQMFIADGGMVEAVGEAEGARVRKRPFENGKGNQQ